MIEQVSTLLVCTQHFEREDPSEWTDNGGTTCENLGVPNSVNHWIGYMVLKQETGFR